MQRNYERDGRAAANYRHNGNNRDNRNYRNDRDPNRDDRANHVPMGKHVTCKKNGFAWFLSHGNGRRMFFNTFHVQYDQYNPDHNMKMSQIHAPYKAWAKEQADKFNRENNIKQMNEARRKEKRNMMHDAGHAYTEQRRAHVRMVNDTHVHRETFLPLRNEVQVFVDTEQQAFLKANCCKSEMTLRSYLGARNGSTGNPLVAPDYISQVISVFPLVYTFRGNIKQMFCYPAEVGITTFHLQTGISTTESIFVYFDKNWFDEGDVDANEVSSREANADLLGIDRDGPTPGNIIGGNVFSSWEAFQWLHEKLENNPSKRIFFDVKQLNFVFYGIKNLAHFTGLNAIRYFQEKIVPNLVSIQDYTVNLLQHAPLSSPRGGSWSREQVEERFGFRQLVPLSDQGHICEHHDSVRSPKKYYCVRAHNARILHNFFHILHENRVEDVYEQCSGPTHRPCIEDMTDSTLRPTLCAQTITVEQAKHFFPEHENPYDIATGGFEPEPEDDVDGDFSSGSESDEDYEYAPCSYNTNLRQDRVQNRPTDSGPMYPRPLLHHDPATELLMSSSYRNPTEPGKNSRDLAENSSLPGPAPGPAPAPSAPVPQAPINFYSNIKSKEQGQQKDNIVELKEGQWETPVIEYIYGFEDSKYYTKRNRPFVPKRFEGVVFSHAVLNPPMPPTPEQSKRPTQHKN